MSNLRGHEFATDAQLAEVYACSLEIASQLPVQRNEALELVAFTGDGLREIVPEHANKLDIGSGLVVSHCVTDSILAYFWPYSDPSSVFASVCLSLGPSEKDNIEWWQQRQYEESEAYRNRPAEGVQEEFEALRSAVFGSFLDREMGVNNWLQYEVTALAGIMKAIMAANLDHVRSILCDPEEIY